MLVQHFAKNRLTKKVPAIRQLLARPSPKQIIEPVEKAFEAGKRLTRPMEMYLCHRCSDKKLVKIAKLFTFGLSASSEASHHFANWTEKNKPYQVKIDRIRDNLNIREGTAKGPGLFLKFGDLTLLTLILSDLSDSHQQIIFPNHLPNHSVDMYHP